MNVIIGILSISLVITTVTSQTPFQDCGSPGVQVQSVNVSGCTTNPCVLKRGTNITSIFTFKALQSFQTLSNAISGRFYTLTINFPIPDPNVCHHGTQCPIKEGQVFKEKITAPVATDYPTIEIETFMELTDANNKKQGCFQVNFKIV